MGLYSPCTSHTRRTGGGVRGRDERCRGKMSFGLSETSEGSDSLLRRAGRFPATLPSYPFPTLSRGCLAHALFDVPTRVICPSGPSRLLTFSGLKRSAPSRSGRATHTAPSSDRMLRSKAPIRLRGTPDQLCLAQPQTHARRLRAFSYGQPGPIPFRARSLRYRIPPGFKLAEFTSRWGPPA
jgi:hypothetical protein